jgi:hypothetical protein
VDGRWAFEADGWRISIVLRDDLRDVLAICKRARLSAVTHSMDLRRADGRPFAAARAAAALDALHLTVSFAVGRWACPAAPVGTDADGAAVWARWAPLHCDHAGRGSTGWWAPNRAQDVEAVIGAFLAAAPNRDGHDAWSTLNYLATASVVAGESGFVEQRLVLAAASLEHLVWTSDVLEGPYSETSLKRGARRQADERDGGVTRQASPVQQAPPISAAKRCSGRLGTSEPFTGARVATTKQPVTWACGPAVAHKRSGRSCSTARPAAGPRASVARPALRRPGRRAAAARRPKGRLTRAVGLDELFGITRSTVYRAVTRAGGPDGAALGQATWVGHR